MEVVTKDRLKSSPTCIKRSPLGQRKWPHKTGDLLKEVELMKFSMLGHKKGDLLIQVTAWASLTVN